MDDFENPVLKITTYNHYKKNNSSEPKKKIQSSGSEFYLKEENIMQMIKSAKSLRNRLVIRLLGITGGRRFEVRNMEIPDVDFGNKRIWINRGKGGNPNGKTSEEKRSRWVDIDDNELIAELKMYIGNRTTGRIIQSNNKKTDGIDLSGINRVVTSTGKLANIKSPNPEKNNLYPHLFRHTLGRRDIPLAAKQKLLGHKDAKTTLQMYGKITFEDARKYAKKDREKKEIMNNKNPLDILKLKLANMEITVEEYEKRKKMLEG